MAEIKFQDNRALWNAFQTLKPAIQAAMEEKLKNI